MEREVCWGQSWHYPVMELSTVSLEGLSDITHSIGLPPHALYEGPEFVVVSFSGRYRDGSLGAPDAKYIQAVLAAVDEAWFCEAVIVDFSQLKYECGDEMSWVFGAGRLRRSQCRRPLALIVGDGCRAGLLSLEPEEYEEYCVESLDEAISRVRSGLTQFRECLRREE